TSHSFSDLSSLTEASVLLSALKARDQTFSRWPGKIIHFLCVASSQMVISPSLAEPVPVASHWPSRLNASDQTAPGRRSLSVARSLPEAGSHSFVSPLRPPARILQSRLKASETTGVASGTPVSMDRGLIGWAGAGRLHVSRKTPGKREREILAMAYSFFCFQNFRAAASCSS